MKSISINLHNNWWFYIRIKKRNLNVKFKNIFHKLNINFLIHCYNSYIFHIVFHFKYYFNEMYVHEYILACSSVNVQLIVLFVDWSTVNNYDIEIVDLN